MTMTSIQQKELVHHLAVELQCPTAVTNICDALFMELLSDRQTLNNCQNADIDDEEGLLKITAALTSDRVNLRNTIGCLLGHLNVLVDTEFADDERLRETVKTETEAFFEVHGDWRPRFGGDPEDMRAIVVVMKEITDE